MSKSQLYIQAPALTVFSLVLALSPSCARTVPLHRVDADSPTTEQKLPFHATADHATLSDTRVDVPPDSKPPSVLPFHSETFSRILPSETLLTVQLETPLSTDNTRAGGAFSASVAAPVVVDDHIVLDRGTEVTGRVESLSPGYFRLALIAISNGGKQVSLQTSSLFARGYPVPSGQHFSAIRVPKGRHLIFRLTAPAFLTESKARVKPQPSVPATE